MKCPGCGLDIDFTGPIDRRERECCAAFCAEVDFANEVDRLRAQASESGLSGAMQRVVESDARLEAFFARPGQGLS